MNTNPPDKKGGRLLILATREENILKAIYFYRYMTALDVAHLLFSPKSINHVREILSRLAGGADEQKVQYLYPGQSRYLGAQPYLSTTCKYHIRKVIIVNS